jgi:hypothetical protein
MFFPKNQQNSEKVCEKAMELGTLKSVIKVNLAEKTYVWDSNMKN